MNIYNGVKLNNGMAFKFFNNHHLNSITIGLYIKAGLLCEEKNIFGISHLIEHLYFRRLCDLEQKELYYLMESMGSSLSGTTYNDCVCFRLTILPRFFNVAIKIFEKIFLHEKWTLEDIRKEKKVVINQIENSYWESFYDYLEKLYFWKTNFESKIMGKKAAIEKMSAKAIHVFKEKIVNPSNSCLVLTGNFTQNNVDETIKLFDIIGNHNEDLVFHDIEPLRFCNRTEEDNFIDDVDYNTSEILINFDIPSDINIYHVKLLSSILGEGVGSKLSLLLREELGLTNEIKSQVVYFSNKNRYVIKFMVNNNHLNVALTETFSVINELKRNITDREFLSSIIFYTENMKFFYDDSRELNFILGYDGFIKQEDITDIDSMIYKYSSISIEELEKTSRELFVDKNLFIGITNNNNITKKSEIKNTLRELRDLLN